MITWSLGSTQLAPGTMSAARPHSRALSYHEHSLEAPPYRPGPGGVPVGLPWGPSLAGQSCTPPLGGAGRTRPPAAQPRGCCREPLASPSALPLTGVGAPWRSHPVSSRWLSRGWELFFWGENRVSMQVSARRLREGLRAAQVHRNRPRLCGGAWQGGEQSSSVYYCTYIYISCVYTDSFLSWKY